MTDLPARCAGGFLFSRILFLPGPEQLNLHISNLRSTTIHDTKLCSDQASSMSVNRQTSSRDPACKPYSAVLKGQRTSKQRKRRPRKVLKELQQLLQESLRGTLQRPRGKSMTTSLPPNMPKHAMIRTNRAGDKPHQPPQAASKETS